MTTIYWGVEMREVKDLNGCDIQGYKEEKKGMTERHLKQEEAGWTCKKNLNICEQTSAGMK